MTELLEAVSEPTSPPDGTKLPRFYASDDGVFDQPKAFPSYEGATPWQTIVRTKTVGISPGGKSGWIAADIEIKAICVIEPCKDLRSSWYHATAVFDADKPWHPVAWQIASPVSGKAQAAALAKGVKPPAIPNDDTANYANVKMAYIPMLEDPKIAGAFWVSSDS